jgi:hypothetical protein
MTAGSFDGRLDPLPLRPWDSFGAEHGEWHLRSVLLQGRSQFVSDRGIHRGLPLALPGRCFMIVSELGTRRVPPEQEIHVSYLAVYPLSK